MYTLGRRTPVRDSHGVKSVFFLPSLQVLANSLVNVVFFNVLFLEPIVGVALKIEEVGHHIHSHMVHSRHIGIA